MQYGKKLAVLIGLFTMTPVQAGMFEVGGSFSWSRSNYNAGSYTWQRTWAASLGYYFTADSEVQFAYQDTTNRTLVQDVQNTTFRDRVYSLNMLYHFFNEHSVIRPFVRLGVGQLNRDATGTYQGGYSPPGRLDQVSVIGGLGFKMRLSQRVAFKTEATSYLTGGAIGSWKDNITFNFGGAFYF